MGSGSKPKIQLPEPETGGANTRRFYAEVPGNHARANRQRPSTVAAKETILRVHLIPLLLEALDRITSENVRRQKHHLHDKARKTVNNDLTILDPFMTGAVERRVIGEMRTIHD